MIDSYKDYTNKKNKTNDICYQVYNISLCGNILNNRRRLLYKDVFNYFTDDKQLFFDIKEFTSTIKDNNLLCKKYLNDDVRQIEGEIDLIDYDNDKIIDFKCSKDTSCKLEWLLQLLTYQSLLTLLEPDKEIKFLSIYNPLQGLKFIFDLNNWNKQTELLDYLILVRERQLIRNKIDMNNFNYGSHVYDINTNNDIINDINTNNDIINDINTNNDINENNDIINDINTNNHNIINDKDVLYMILDTETTGLPKIKKNGYNDYKELDKYDSARMVQLSWLIMNKNKILKIKDYIIKIDNLQTNYATSLHGVSDIISDTLGVSYEDAFNEFMNDLHNVDYIVGHNIDFDINIIKSELFRLNKLNIIELMNNKKIFCTMKYYENEFNKSKPSLAECYFKLYNKMIVGAHNSKYDIIYTMKIFGKYLENI
jgi:DNA polymerase III epsilon subunit-like protein